MNPFQAELSLYALSLSHFNGTVYFPSQSPITMYLPLSVLELTLCSVQKLTLYIYDCLDSLVVCIVSYPSTFLHCRHG